MKDFGFLSAFSTGEKSVTFQCSILMIPHGSVLKANSIAKWGDVPMKCTFANILMSSRDDHGAMKILRSTSEKKWKAENYYSRLNLIINIFKLTWAVKRCPTSFSKEACTLSMLRIPKPGESWESWSILLCSSVQKILVAWYIYKNLSDRMIPFWIF